MVLFLLRKTLSGDLLFGYQDISIYNIETDEVVMINELAADTDGDFTADIADNCPDIANGFQTDTDNDGHGDACDPLFDFDGDADVDRDDIRIVAAARNTLPEDEDDHRDANRDGRITARDARAMMVHCTRPRCAVESPVDASNDGER